MNVYICIRSILHLFLFLVNLCALTTASLFVSALKTQGHRATAGAVLVILGSIFYGFITIGLWSEICLRRSKFSRNRSEALIIPPLFLFQIIGAIVSTVEATRGMCHDQSFGVALVILAWMCACTLLVYYLITIIVTLYHYVSDEDVWDQSPLGYAWFPIPAIKERIPPVKSSISSPLRPRSSNEFTHPPSVDIEIASIEPPPPPPPPAFPAPRRRPLSSWMPPPLDLENKMRRPPVRVMRSADVATESNESNRQESSAETFTEIPLQQAPTSTVQEPDTRPRSSVGVPAWAKKLRSAKRGVGLPFPLVPTSTRIRPANLRNQDPRSIDAPVSPSFFTE